MKIIDPKYQEKVTKIEQLCPGIEFIQCIDADVIVMKYPTPSGSQIGPYYLDKDVSITQFLDWIIEDYTPQEIDKYFNVLCPTCGKVQIGYRNYCDQMSIPWAKWICPKCSGVAEFDDDSYEAMTSETN